MIRIGQGYDVHKFAAGRKLIIGGTEIDYERGLSGHSDADVLIHAIMDAMLGALALGDIGKMFPDNDDRYKGADSMKLLTEVNKAIMSRGYKVSNIDSTIIAQEPRMSPYIDTMRKNISDTLGIKGTQVSVKATTEEGLGFTGQKLGIAAWAVVLLEEN